MSKLIALLGMLIAANAFAIDLGDVGKKLETTGVEGWIHGSVQGYGLYVFTVRNPADFFDFAELSLVTHDPAIRKQLDALSRHDAIRVKGAFLDNPSPQKHVKIASIELLKKYDSGFATDPYGYEAHLPDELVNATTGVFLVHSVREGGHVLVVEYKDAILPIFVQNAELSKSLYRGDVVQLSIGVQDAPTHPTHLVIREADARAVQVLQSISALHGKPASVEGPLVLFPQSPEILFNVFAVGEDAGHGLKRQYTLVNFDSPDTFTAIRTKLQAAWDRHAKDYVNGRNKLVSTRVRVRATGTFNEVDPNQANPQILLTSPDSIEVLEN
jgi:hypothetical protein